MTQAAGSVACVNPFVDLFAALRLALLRGQTFQVLFQAPQGGLRQAIREVKSDVLNRFRAFKMRQVAATVLRGRLPVAEVAGSAILLNGGFGGSWAGECANREIGVPRLRGGH